MSPSGKPTLREEKHQATALRVERSAVGLVLEHGLGNVTVGMICEASGISQRTFFNYFKTKDAAVLGAEPPQIDEGQARAFIAADGPDLLPQVLELLTSTALSGFVDEKLFADRIRLLGQNPQLMQKQMERMNRVTNEMTELVYLRLKRAAGPAEDGPDPHEQAELLTHAMLGVLRFVAVRWIPVDAFADAAGTPGDAPATPRATREEALAHTVGLLRRTLRMP